MVATNTSGHPLLQRPFCTKPTVIPQFLENKWTGKVFKIEQVLARSLDSGAKQHVWLAPDPRPHNHPWAWIACKLLRGSYTAMEYVPNGDGSFTEIQTTLRAGDPEHVLVHNAYHQIVEVEPGTVSLMTFGSVVGDGRQWGNLVKDEYGAWVHDSNINIDGYLDVMRHFNPHLRPDGWVDPYAHLPVPTVEELLTSAGL